MSENYLDSTSFLPRRVGELYSDRSIKVVGQVRWWPTSNSIETLGVRIYCTPTGGGANAVAVLPDGLYTMTTTDSSVWVRVNRASGSITLSGADILQYHMGKETDANCRFICDENRV